MKKSILKVTLATIGVIVTLPLSVYAGGDDQQQLAKLREVKLQGIDGRLGVLQQEKSCLQAASTMDALRSCEQATHKAMNQLRAKYRAGMESLKASGQQGKENKK